MKKNLLLITFFTVFSQQAFSQSQFYGTWYLMEPGNDQSRQRMVIGENGITTERYQDYGVDEPYWQKDKDTPIFDSKVNGSNYQIVGYSEDENRYYGGEFFFSEQAGELKVIQMRAPNESVEEAYQKLDENKYKPLMSKTLYSKERLEEINALPPLKDITKQELIETIKHVQSFGPMMEDFMNHDTNSRARFMIVRAAEHLREKKFIELGYNPFIFTEEFYMDKFKDDPDIEALNETSTYIKF